jgi:signal transduction histidine kinase
VRHPAGRRVNPLRRRHEALRRWRHASRRWRHSIQKRLVLLFVLLALGTSAVFMFGTQRVVRSGWQVWAQPLVGDYVDRLAAEVLPATGPPDLARARAIAERLPLVLRIEGPAVPGGRWDSHPDAWRRGFWHGQRIGRDADADEADDDQRHGSGMGEAWGLVRQRADGHRVTFRLRPQPDDAAQPRRVGWMTLAGLLLLTLLAWATVRRQLAPLQGIGAGVEAYGRGEFGTPIPVRRDDELGDLAQRINGMAANLSGMLEAKRALLLAISHELRSPLTRARLNAELLEPSAERSALLRDLGEMRDLITQLLEGERLAQGHAALQREPLDLAALVHEVVEAANGAGDAAFPPLRLDLEPLRGPVQGDPMRLKLLLRNLIDNARRHGSAAADTDTGATPPSGLDAPPSPVVFVRLGPDGQVALGVRDFGRGHDLPDHQLALLGHAFYRPDSARSREHGGVGLGLHLCRLVAQAHGGVLRIRRAAPGLEIAAVWPLR